MRHRNYRLVRRGGSSYRSILSTDCENCGCMEAQAMMQQLQIFAQDKPDPDLSRGKRNRHSQAAHRKLKPYKPLMRDLVHFWFADHPGATLEQCADGMGKTVNSLSGRITELKRDGRLLIVGEGKTRAGDSCARYRAV